MKTMMKQIFPLQSMEDHTAKAVHTAACGLPHTRAGGYALKEASAQESPHRSGLLKVALACGKEPTQKKVFWQELQTVGRTSAGAVCELLYPITVTPHWSRAIV